METMENNKTVNENETVKKEPTAEDIFSAEEKQQRDANAGKESSGQAGQEQSEASAGQDTAPQGNASGEQNDWQQKADEYADLLKRKMAEFDNYKRRTENEKAELADWGASRMINQLLPVVDDFDRTVSHLNTTTDIEVLKKGVLAVYDKLQKVLQNNKITKVPSVGLPFDVDLHEALMRQPSTEYPPDTVIQEFIPAYKFKEKIIRHAQVVVSDETSGKTEEQSSEQANA